MRGLRIVDCTTWLKPAEPGDDAPYRVVPGRAEYDAAHIPGAVFFDIQGTISDPDTRLRFMAPAAERLADAMGALGIGDESRVVLYSAGSIMWATRVWWMLRAFGFDRAAVLDGGWEKWQAEGRPVSSAPGRHPPARSTARPASAFCRRAASATKRSPMSRTSVRAERSWTRTAGSASTVSRTASGTPMRRFRTPRGRYSMLAALAVPPVSADTEFADMRAAYDTLAAETKAGLEGLRVHHSIAYSRMTLGFEFSEEESDRLKGAIQPLVLSNPRTGRRSLYLASHASRVLDRPVPDGRLLLRDLMEHATRPALVYRHSWRSGDFVIWDNRATMHRARPFDDTRHRREMRRVTTLDTGDPARIAQPV